ncbi:leucine-rich repeat receptor protein kinase HPCA1-like isoform X3 [Salvia miltiorrhiza]|uniref:leucine-rich repeat receptor protein kinase HPCA1-like isoform X3 n=1 Tax=Salvia miltiorrhiza TaxID=226208 RepID=UPI0025AC0B9D|nr:leucine-rich repeat receptor protein kinase HPCA1-like isoform X3 [Salvia miltiorrhiza]
MKLRRFRLEELQKATDNFSHDFLIGHGSFANVYRGTFPVEGTLAIKKPHSEAYTSTEDFRNEVRLLSKVKHENLVALVGFCEETGKKGPKAAKILVYEYVANGSLLDYIIGKGGRSLTWRERVKIAIGAAKGIGHLHEGIRPSIIHRDLKPSNILVGEGFEAKARLSIEKGKIGDILDTNLLVQGCNMEMMVKMGEIALRCVVKVPKERPTMSQVRQELEAALKAADDEDLPPPPPAASMGDGDDDQRKSGRIHRSSDSVVSVDGIGLERFHVELDSVSFQSVSLRCLETSISMD